MEGVTGWEKFKKRAKWALLALALTKRGRPVCKYLQLENAERQGFRNRSNSMALRGGNLGLKSWNNFLMARILVLWNGLQGKLWEPHPLGH